MKLACGLLLLSAFASAFGQSTASLASAEAAWSYQLTIGTSSRLVGSSYGSQGGPLRAIDLEVERAVAGPMRLRFDSWLVERHPSRDNFYRKVGKTQFIAGVFSGAFPIHLSPDVVLAPTIGVAVVPFAHLSATQDPSGAPSVTAQGVAPTAGLALRWSHLVIEQHVLQIIGADGALVNGETAPLTIGLRF